MQDDDGNRKGTRPPPMSPAAGPMLPGRLFARLRDRRMTHHEAALSDFVAYWQNRRVAGDVPRRTDIDPRGIEALLSNAFIMERIAPGLARLRIAGMHLSDLMAMEVRGMPVSALFTPGHRDALARYLVRVFDEPAMLRLSLRARGGVGTPALTGTMLILPLRSDLGDISRALGCLVTHGTPGTGPRRFDIDRASVTPLDTFHPERLAETGPQAPNEAAFAEASAPFEPALPAERPYLRLVRGS